MTLSARPQTRRRQTRRLGLRRILALRLTVSSLVAALLLALASIASAATTVDFHTFTATEIAEFQLNGVTASLSPNGDAVLRLTSSTGQSGSAFLTDSVSLANDKSFSTAFQFSISDPIWGGADGLVFVLQTNNNTAGGGGGGIGYAGIPNSVGVEFDNWHNGDVGDINDNHVGIDLEGSVASVVQASVSGLGQLENGQAWYAWVDYDGLTDLLEVRLSTTNVRPAAALLSYTVDLVDVLGTDDAYIGFTSGTGGAGAKHDILGWEFRNDFDPVPDVPEREVGSDADGDGVDDDTDPFPESNTSESVAIGGCDSGVENQYVGGGTYFNDLIGAEAAAAKNHGDFVRRVTKLADGWKKSGLISGQQHGKITSCAARSNVP